MLISDDGCIKSVSQNVSIVCGYKLYLNRRLRQAFTRPSARATSKRPALQVLKNRLLRGGQSLVVNLRNYAALNLCSTKTARRSERPTMPTTTSSCPVMTT